MLEPPFREIRYSRWDGTQRLDALEAEELLRAMSDEILSGAELEGSLARLSRRGIPDRMEGLEDLLEQLRAARRRRAERHGLSGIFDELRKKLDEVKALERAGLERRAAAEAPTPELGEAMRKMAEERTARLDALPEDVGRAIRALKDYEFVEPKAAEKYGELLRQLQEQVLGSYFKNLREQLGNLTPERLERTRRMMRDLNRALRERMEGGEPDFEAFQREYPELAGRAKDWDDLVEQLAQGMAAMRSLMASMSPEMRSQLEELLGAAFDDPGLQQAMSELAETLGRLMPMEGTDHGLGGDEPLTLAEALGLMDDLNKLSDWEEIVRSARDQDDLGALDPAEVERLAGAPARRSLDELRRLTELLEDAGLIRKDGERYELTPRAIRKIGQHSLEEIFAHLKRDAFGGHRASARGRGGEPTDELKSYEFGDPFLLDLPGTVRNAIIRAAGAAPRGAEPGEPPRTVVRLRAEDFQVWRTELLTQSASAILVDVSRSMLFRGCFLAAKKVTLALDSLIRSTYPKDDLHIIGFSAYAQELKPTDLAKLTWNEYVYGTNMQAAFETARTLLARSRGTNKQILLITDGEPTAHVEDGRVRFAYPPTRRTFEETLREVVRCTRAGVTINTFMLARGHYLVDFVNQMSKINHGRAFYVEPEKLGEYVLVDYVSNKRRRVA